MLNALLRLVKGDLFLIVADVLSLLLEYGLALRYGILDLNDALHLEHVICHGNGQDEKDYGPYEYAS